LDVLAANSADLTRIVEQSTIPNTVASNFACPVPAGPPMAAQPPVPAPRFADYDFEDWESYDLYPYNDITVLPPQPGVGCVVILPGIGRWIIPVDVFGGWRFDPVVIAVYCRHIILDRLMYHDHYYLADVRLRKKQLNDLMYLAQLSGNRNMLLDAQRRLADLNVQSRWAAMRLNRLQTKLTGLEQEQNKFAHKLPPGKNLFQAVSNSLNSPANLPIVQNFRERIKTEQSIQNQVAGLAGNELMGLRSRIAREKNPQARLALADEFTRLNGDVNKGKLPIPAGQQQVRQVVEKLAKEQDPQKLQGLQKQLNQITKIQEPRTSELLSPDKLASLKQDLAKFPNPQKRNDLETNLTQLQQSVEARTAIENNTERIDAVTARAAKEPDVQKRNEILGQLKELAKPAAVGAGLVGGLGLLGKRQLLETQLSAEADKQKRATLEQALEDQRKLQAESLRKQADRGIQADAVRKQQEELKKQTDQRRLGEQPLKPTDQVRQQQLQQQGLQQQQLDQKHQEELRKQTEQKLHQEQLDKQQAEHRRKQEELQKQTQEKLHREQLEKQQTEQKKLQLQQQQKEKVLLQQQEEQRRRQADTERLKKLEEAAQTRKKQLQTEELHKQQQLKEQQNRQLQQGEQIRRQQLQTDQLRLQQEQMRQQQLRQQQMQQQQMQQQQLRELQMRQQQMRQQQSPGQQQQLPSQQQFPPLR
ncbi:MAG TPA: hypothetical protein VK463_08960, partial [Desulfomonilaceae bacterium]|nr:hypothetical protein [Desulfomonilaceae bacterium]